MKKLIHFIQKNYIYINITVLLLTIYVVLFPILSIPIKQVFPSFGQCPYLRTTGKPCPLCGGTRYIENLPTMFQDITYLFHPFGVIMIGIFCESIFRIYNLITRKKEKLKRYITLDLQIHLIAWACFILYEIVFVITN